MLPALFFASPPRERSERVEGEGGGSHGFVHAAVRPVDGRGPPEIRGRPGRPGRATRTRLGTARTRRGRRRRRPAPARSFSAQYPRRRRWRTFRAELSGPAPSRDVRLRRSLRTRLRKTSSLCRDSFESPPPPPPRPRRRDSRGPRDATPPREFLVPGRPRRRPRRPLRRPRARERRGADRVHRRNSPRSREPPPPTRPSRARAWIPPFRARACLAKTPPRRQTPRPQTPRTRSTAGAREAASPSTPRRRHPPRSRPSIFPRRVLPRRIAVSFRLLGRGIVPVDGVVADAAPRAASAASSTAGPGRSAVRASAAAAAASATFEMDPCQNPGCDGAPRGGGESRRDCRELFALALRVPSPPSPPPPPRLRVPPREGSACEATRADTRLEAPPRALAPPPGCVPPRTRPRTPGAPARNENRARARRRTTQTNPRRRRRGRRWCEGESRRDGRERRRAPPLAREPSRASPRRALPPRAPPVQSPPPPPTSNARIRGDAARADAVRRPRLGHGRAPPRRRVDGCPRVHGGRWLGGRGDGDLLRLFVPASVPVQDALGARERSLERLRNLRECVERLPRPRDRGVEFSRDGIPIASRARSAWLAHHRSEVPQNRRRPWKGPKSPPVEPPRSPCEGTIDVVGERGERVAARFERRGRGPRAGLERAREFRAYRSRRVPEQRSRA